MPGLTNRGKLNAGKSWLLNAGAPTQFNVMLFTAAFAPGPDTNVVSDLTEIAAGNGYTTGGVTLERSAVGFDLTTENDANDRAEFQLKDIIFTAAGGPIPASGAAIRYACIVDNNATIANREVFAYFDLTPERTVNDGNPLTLQNFEVRLTEL